MGRKKHHEDHVNHEAWAIPYGDLMTLLLAFFVVMYSMSSVNEGKYRVLSDSLVAAFHGQPKTTRPIQIGDDHPSGTADQGVNDAVPLGTVDRSILSIPLETPPDGIDSAHGGQESQLGAGLERIADDIRSAHGDQESPLGAGLERIADDIRSAHGDQESPLGAGLERIADDIRSALAELIELEQVRIRETPLWLEVEIKTDLLFSVGDAEVAPGALPTLQRLADILNPMPNPIRVEGHTDDVPISTARYPSNWELSAARASSVIRLFQKRGVVPQRMIAIGLGEFSPADDNNTSAGRNRNRRVTIIILANDEVPVTASSSISDTGDGL